MDSLLCFPWVLLNIFLSKHCYLLQVACVHNYSKNINKVTVLFNYIEIQPYQSNKILYENNFKPSVNYIVMISSCFQFSFTLVFWQLLYATVALTHKDTILSRHSNLSRHSGLSNDSVSCCLLSFAYCKLQIAIDKMTK